LITNDIPASSDGGSYTLNLKFDVPTTGVQLAIDEGYLSYRDDPTGQISITFNWKEFKYERWKEDIISQPFIK
jgi:hypothetical protein